MKITGPARCGQEFSDIKESRTLLRPFIHQSCKGKYSITIWSFPLSILHPDIVIILDPTLLESPAAAVAAGATEETVFLVNTSEGPAEIRRRLKVNGNPVHTVDATQIALDCFGKSIPNMPMIGALLRVLTESR